jgi:UDP-N-acetylmuramoyl-L-alanyl-D-glutamate--2,6-diaminopimelate ligase
VVTTGPSPDAAWRASAIEASLEGSAFRLDGPAGSRGVRLRLAGHFNVANALGALATADALGIDLDAAVAGLAELPGVPGRFERVEAGQPFTVLVDYAHTPDSLENVLRAARAVTGKRLLVVFGCGGDRDRGKRPLMGEIAGRLADLAIVTSDNPRSEPPESIVAEVAEGVRRGAAPGAWAVEVDRRAAIRQALAEAGPGDAVIIAGKGHEQGQELAGGRRIPFDDRVVAAEELRRLGLARSGR